jgi:hypothetical protein
VGPEAPPYADKIILSPHIYPASVIPRGCTGKGLCNRLSNSWGHLSVKVTCAHILSAWNHMHLGAHHKAKQLPRSSRAFVSAHRPCYRWLEQHVQVLVVNGAQDLSLHAFACASPSNLLIAAMSGTTLCGHLLR